MIVLRFQPVVLPILMWLMVPLCIGNTLAAQEVDSNPILATFNGNTITRGDYNLYLRSCWKEITRKRPHFPDHREVLENYALIRIASASLENQVTREIIHRNLHWDIWSLQCHEAYTRLAEAVFRPGTAPTQEEVEKYYQDHLAELTGRKEFSFRNIFFDLSRCPDDSCRSEMERTSNETLSILKARVDPVSGTIPLSSFLEVASTKTGKATTEFQVRGPFPMGEINPELEQTAMSLEPGQISGLLKTRMGLQILRLETKSTGDPPAFEKVEEDIRRQIQASRINQRRRDFYKATATPERIQITAEGLGEIIRWATAPNEVKDVLLAKAGSFTLNVLDYLRYVKANSRGLLPSPDQSADEIRQTHEDFIKSRILEQELVRQKSEEMGLTQDATYTSRIKVGMEVLMGGRYLQVLVQSHHAQLGPVPENEIEQYYQQHSAEFQSNAQYRLREIAIKPVEATGPVEIEMAMREAEKRILELLGEIRKGANEEEIIKKFSHGEEAARGGVTGWLIRDTRYSPLVWNDLVDLPLGAWTSKTYRHRGMAIALKMEEKIPSEPLTLEQARSDIGTRLFSRMRNEESKRIRNGMLEKADFRLVQEEVNRLTPMKEFFH